MSAPVDLRSTDGWHLSGHAAHQARARGVSVREILEVIADPWIRHTAFNEGTGRFVYKRGDLAVVAVPHTRTIVTVLWNKTDEWTSEQFRTRHAA